MLLCHVCACYLVGTWLIGKNTPIFFCVNLQLLWVMLWLCDYNFYFHLHSLYRAALCQHSGPDRLFPSGSD